ncbi:hypothetical protein QBC41DRAFT_279498 [Cercophora samala]|uniref:Uncharacterized protein n=1 Tax=Cercophora samala TaxID=330535 RepID=A0AA39ZAF3_9PEZI|nr:hypothetical protein QBC41DRAFT_279498 [Cercophora samala]
MPDAAASPRDLVLRNGTQAEKSVTPVDLEPKPDIGEGNQRLHSFYRPGLVAGTYNIDVEQDIAKYNPSPGQRFADIPAADKLDPKKSSKSFTVIAPQYSLPPGSLNTTYPAPGHQTPHTTLPHVVLNDPQLPWERVGSESELSIDSPEQQDVLSKTRTPWLAVIAFTQDEIMLPAEAEASLESLLKLPKSPKPFAPSPTFTYNVNMSDFVHNVGESKALSTPLTSFDASIDDPTSTKGDIVCVKSQVLQELVRTFDDKGQPNTSQAHPDVSRYRWLAHVRQVDTAGMAQAGSTTGLLGERDSLFSVVLAHRTGPLGRNQPTSVVAHLISIEGLEAMPFPFKTPYVALTSLHSWSYMSLPPNSVSLHDAFRHIGDFQNVDGIQRQLLRAPATRAELDSLRSRGDGGRNMASRLENGYSLARYRLQTGEQTVSFFRGPLVPTSVKYPLQPGWDLPSTHGTNRQIFDRQVGIMDISYSSAWQLGRTLALADRSFTVALARVRRQIQEAGVQFAKKEEMEKKTLFRTKVSTIKSLAASMSLLERLPESDTLLTSDVSNRWQAKSVARVDVSFNAMGEGGSDSQKEKLQRQLDKAAEEVSGSLQDANVPYDEFNTPRSTDWMAVLKWVLDRMYLADIPAHYLISDPSHLPLETIRFFEVDRNWTDSLIDGALSLANHLERSDDMVRRAMQHALKRYLATESKGLGRVPPVPLYGFLLRSELVTAFPDMVVKTEPTPPASQPVLIRHQLLDTNVMLCLFDRPPTKGSFESITLSQPPHQPCFSIASVLTTEEIDITLKSVYSGAIKDQPHKDARVNDLKNGQDAWQRGEAPTDTKPVVFIWDVDDQTRKPPPYGNDPALRFLNVNSFATWTHGKVVAGMKGTDGQSQYTEAQPTSSLIAYELNDPSWQLKIQLDQRPISPSTSNHPDSLQPAGALRAAISDPSSASITTPASNTPKTTLQSTGPLQRSNPFPLPLPPPNTSTMPTKLTTPPPAPSSSSSSSSLKTSPLNTAGSGPASSPTFHFRIFSIDPSTPDTILTPSPLPQDLIFSITLQDDPRTLSTFRLSKITFLIPFNRVPEVLTTDYTGPGGFMITNLRFNVVCSLVKEGPFQSSKRSLKVELLPRTHLRSVFAGECLDLTFLLAGVVVAEVSKRPRLSLGAKVRFAEREDIDVEIGVDRPPR